MTRILVFAGSARRESLNKKLASLAAAKAKALGAEVTLADMADYPMPLYDGDHEAEAGVPETAAKFRDLMIAHDGFLISCPEYNGSITPLLKNAIDWASRPADGVAMLAAFRGKVAGLLSASPGGFGGMRGLVHVRAILSGVGVLVLPGDVSVAKAHEAFSEDGELSDERAGQRLNTLVETTLKSASALKP